MTRRHQESGMPDGMGVSQILNDIKSSCIDEGFDEDAVKEFMDARRDDTVIIIYERDDSTHSETLWKNTDDIPVWVRDSFCNYGLYQLSYFDPRGYPHPDLGLG